MIIYDSQNRPIIGLDVDDTSYRYREIMGDNNVHLEFSLTQHVELPIGAYIEFQGERYTLMSPADVAIVHNRDYEYKVNLEGPQARFSKYRVHNPVDGRLIFEMIAYPEEHLAVILSNLNEREGASVWSVGACITGPQRTMTYNHTTLRDALTALANLYDTEWEVSAQHTISLGKVERNTSSPLSLGYGLNNGFKEGVGRTNYGETGQIERLYIQGGERNISLAEYGNTTLLLPKNFSFKFDGSKFKYTKGAVSVQENGFNASKAVDMVTDANGYSVMIAGASAACNEESLDLTDIYPKREGTVTDVRYVYQGNYYTWQELSALSLTDDEWLQVQMDIIDNTIPASLDYDEYMLDNNDPMVVTFQSGMLAGREFSVQKFYKEAEMATVNGQSVEYRPANRFELVRANYNGIDMPNASFRPNAGQTQDKYIVTNCYLPDAYICDYATASGAEFEALRQAAKFLYENKDIQFTFRGEIDDLYSKRNWSNVGGKLVLGGNISFSHEQVQPTPLVTRIIAIKDFINNPYAPEVTLSNEAVKGGLSSRLAQIKGETARAQSQTASVQRYAKRSFRDAKETMSMLIDAALEGYTEQISPIAIQTMQALVGDESLQFRYVTSKVNPVVCDSGIAYNPSTKKLTCTANIIQHMTLGIDSLSNAHALSEYMFWDIDSFESPYLGDALSSVSYYLYAKCNKAEEGESGYQEAEYVLSATPIGLNDVSGYYHLLVGLLNSEVDDDRSFAPVFGFTEILPGRITTDKIVSSSGETYIDLLQNIINFGNKLTYNNGNLVLNGSLVVTGSGEPVVLGAYCGNYDNTRTYKLGDEVTWEAEDGTVSTYRYINSVAGSGHSPADDNYWEVSAKGVKGEDGQDAESPVYADLTNEMDSVPLTSDGKTYGSSSSTAVTMTTTAQMYYGITELTLTNIELKDESGTSTLPSGFESPTFEKVNNQYTGKITFTIKGNKTIALKNEIKIKLTASFGQVSYVRYVTFAVAGVKAGTNGTNGTNGQDGQDGSNGADAIRYYLVPSVTSVKKDKAGNYSIAKVSCKRYRQIGANTAEEVFSVGTLKHSLDGGSELPASGTDSASTEINTSSFTKTLTWIWYINGVVADRETIPMIIDGTDGTNGTNGTNGQDGSDGNSVSSITYAYAGPVVNGDTPPADSTFGQEGGSRPTAQAGKYIWRRTTTNFTKTASQKVYESEYCPQDGTDGTNGTNGSNGPASPYIGEYSSSKTYYGTSVRCDVVHYSSTGKFYMALPTVGEFSNKVPTNTAYWSEFGSSFDNVATGFLLAVKAVIENAIVRDLLTADSGARIQASGNALSMFDTNNVLKLLVTGQNLGATPTGANITITSTSSVVTKTCTAAQINSGQSFNGNGAISLGSTLQVSSNVNSVKIPNMSVTVQLSNSTSGGSFEWNGEMYLAIFDSNGNEVAGGSYNQFSIAKGTSSKSVSLSGFTCALAAGNTYTLRLVISSGISGSGVSSGSATFYIKAPASSMSGSSGIVISYPAQVTAIGANGFRAMFSDTQKAEFINDNGTISLTLIYGNNGIRLNSSGLQMNVANSGWKTASINSSGYLVLS